MDKPETLKILAILRVAYPNFYRTMDADEYNDTVILLCDLFKPGSKKTGSCDPVYEQWIYPHQDIQCVSTEQVRVHWI